MDTAKQTTCSQDFTELKKKNHSAEIPEMAGNRTGGT